MDQALDSKYLIEEPRFGRTAGSKQDALQFTDHTHDLDVFELNTSCCTSLVRGNIVGTWYRAVDPPYLATAISTTHTLRITSRFSPATHLAPGFEILYLAENPLVALFETEALFGSLTGPLVPSPARALVILPISVNVTDITDLTDGAQAHLVETNAQELTGDWRRYAHRKSSPPSPHAVSLPHRNSVTRSFTSWFSKA
jgi:RES domain-containing protein